MSTAFLPPSVQAFDCFCRAFSYVVPRWTAAPLPHRSSMDSQKYAAVWAMISPEVISG